MDSDRSVLFQAQVQTQRFQCPAPNASHGLGRIQEVADGLNIQASDFGDLRAGRALQPGVNPVLDVDTLRLESGWGGVTNPRRRRWGGKKHVGRRVVTSQVM